MGGERWKRHVSNLSDKNAKNPTYFLTLFGKNVKIFTTVKMITCVFMSFLPII